MYGDRLITHVAQNIKFKKKYAKIIAYMENVVCRLR